MNSRNDADMKEREIDDLTGDRVSTDGVEPGSPTGRENVESGGRPDTDGGADHCDEDDDESPDGSLAIDAPEDSPNDEAITIRIVGADPGETVAFEASMVDEDGVAWRSRATCTADAAGVVDLSERAPGSGTYEGVEPMGWLWSMTPTVDVRSATLDTADGVAVTLRAKTRKRRTERTITRRLVDEEVTRRAVDRENVVGTIYEPSGDGPRPGVIVLHGSSGEPPARTARLLAAHGYAVLAIRYFGDADAIPDELARIPLSYFDGVADWLRSRPAVADGQIGLVGVSRGAELALVLGARFGWVGAVVSYAGSGVVYDTPSGTPAWTDGGEPLPHVTGVGEPERTDDGRFVSRPVLKRGLDIADEETRREATIRVEETDGPVLLLSGGDDQVWPARRLSNVAADRLERRCFPYDFAHLTYDSVGHLVSVPYVPLRGFDHGGGTASATARAGADSWPAVLDYLAEGLDANGDGRTH